MRTLHIQFSSGREVLSHYWGLLSGGGLAIHLDEAGAAAAPFAASERLHLQVTVVSIKKAYDLDVQVLSVRGLEDGRTQLMVAFLPETTPDELLDAAWADGCDSPQRRSRRTPMQLKVRYERLDGRGMEGRDGRLINLSSGGCCVEGTALPPPGTQVLLTTTDELERVEGSVKLVGKVRWTERPEGGMMGIEFLGQAPEVSQLLLMLSPVRPPDEPL